MGKRGKGRRVWVLALAALTAGCDGQDAERLARLGRKAVAKVQAQTGDSPAGLSGPLQSIRGNLNELTLDAKVAARLRWDKDLEGAQVQVRTAGAGAVRLSGTVATLEQRQRAVGLARATVGVNDVIDELVELKDGK